MDEKLDLDALYGEAQAALASKDLKRAGELLKQVLIYDENYKDASRLLAKVVARQRRRMYRDWRLWTALGVLVLAGISLFGAARLGTIIVGQPGAVEPTAISVLLPSETSTRPTPRPTYTPRPTQTARPTKTAIPLAWKRLSTGNFLVRDVITSIAIHPSDPDVLYVGTATAGIYKSIDGGLSWRPAHNGLRQASVHSLLIDPRYPDTVFAGLPGIGIHKSTDGGERWVAVNDGIQDFGWMGILVMDPRNAQHLYYMPGDTLYESKDGGVSWHRIKTSECPDRMSTLAAHPTEIGMLYSGSSASERCPAGVYTSLDAGRTWVVAEVPTESVADLAVGFDAGLIYYNDENGEAYRSNDGGRSWIRVAGGCHLVEANPLNSQEIYCAVWGSEHPSDPGRILKSTDGGGSWATVYRLAIGWTHAVVFSPRDPRTVFVGGGGFHVSTDSGKSWVERGDGLPGTRLSLWLDPLDSSTMYGEDSTCRLYRSSDAGVTWGLISDQGCGLAFDGDHFTLYRAGADRLLRSQDQGAKWDALALPEILGPYVPVAAHPVQPGKVFAFYRDRGVQVSLDGGGHWRRIEGTENLPAGWLAFDQADGNTMYAVGSSDPVYRSQDGGDTWQPCGNTAAFYGPIEGMASRSPLILRPEDAGRLFLATRGKGILISSDGCRSWLPSNSGLGSLSVNSLAIDPQIADTVYAGTDGGAYVSFDGGQSWGPINDGLLGATVVYSIVVDPEGTVCAATPYGVFRLEAR